MSLQGAERHTPRARSGPAFPGPLLMLFPLLFLAAGIAFLQSRKPPPLAPPQPPAEVQPVAVRGWAGRLGTPEGELTAKLRPLHEDGTRQAFDAKSLARRLNLGAGEPWSLELSLRGGEEEGSASIELAGLTVHDREGESSRPLPRVEPPAESAVADPLAVLFSPPARLRRGKSVRLLLWGKEPGEGVELRGSFGALSLRSRSFEVPEHPLATARLQRRRAEKGRRGE